MQIVMMCGKTRVNEREIPSLLSNNPLYLERIKQEMIREHSETICVLEAEPSFHLEAPSKAGKKR